MKYSVIYSMSILFAGVVLLISSTTGKAQCTSTSGGAVIQFSQMDSTSSTGDTLTGCLEGGARMYITISSSGIYVFSSELSTDFLTVTDASGIVVGFGTQSVSIPIAIPGVYRLYLHNNILCGSDLACRALTGGYFPLNSCAFPDSIGIDNAGLFSADISWNGSTSSSYEYILSTNPAVPVFSTQGVSTVTTSVNLNNLTPSTSYYFYLRQHCASDTSMWVGPISFSTACSVQSTPYFENFDGPNFLPNIGWPSYSDSMGTCWERNPSQGRGSWKIGDEIVTTSSGPSNDHTTGQGNFLFFLSDNVYTTQTAVVTSPEIDISNLSEPELSFYYHAFGAYNGSFYINYWDGFAWTTLDSITGVQHSSQQSDWRLKNVFLPTNIDTIRLQFEASPFSPFAGTIQPLNYAGNFAIDDLTVAEKSNCGAVDFQDIDVSYSSAGVNLTWDARDINAGEWKVKYRVVSSTPSVFDSVITTAPNVTLQGLASNENYEFYISEKCFLPSTGFGSEIGPTTFKTPYASPYSETFDYGPTDYSTVRYTDMGSYYVKSPDFNGPGGIFAPEIIWNPGDTSDAMKLIFLSSFNPRLAVSPMINVPMTSPFLEMKVHSVNNLVFSTNYQRLKRWQEHDSISLIVSTDQLTWQKTDIIHTWSMHNFPSVQGEYMAIDMSAYAGELIQLAFMSNDGLTSELYVDSLRISSVLTCIPPQTRDIKVVNPKVNQVEVTWEPFDNSIVGFEVQYDTARFDFGTGQVISVSGTQATITGLDTATYYELFIRQECSPGVFSSWVGPIRFHTADILPYQWDLTTFIPRERGVEFKAGVLTDSTAFLSNDDATWLLSQFQPFYKIHPTNYAAFEWIISPSLTIPNTGHWAAKIDIEGQPSTRGESWSLILSRDNGETWSKDDVLWTWEPSSNQRDTMIAPLYNLNGETIKIGLYHEGMVKPDAAHTKRLWSFEVDTFNQCLQPSVNDFIVLDQRRTSVEVHWANPMEYSYRFEYGPVGFSQGSGTTVQTDSNRLLIDGLMASTEYEFYVVKSCHVNPLTFSDTIGPIQFMTAFDGAYLQDFEMILPNLPGWQRMLGYLDTIPSRIKPGPGVFSTDLYPPFSPGNSRIGVAKLYPPSNPLADWWITPSFYLDSSANWELSFEYGLLETQANSFLTDSARLIVLMSTDNGRTWKRSDEILSYHSNQTTMLGQSQTFNMNLYGLGDYVKFAFYTESEHGSTLGYKYFYFDNFEITTTGGCLSAGVQDVYLTSIGDTSYAITIDPSILSLANWVVEYGPAGFSQGTGIADTLMSYPDTLNGFSPFAAYDFYVRALCLDPSFTNNYWTGPINTMNSLPVPTPIVFNPTNPMTTSMGSATYAMTGAVNSINFTPGSQWSLGYSSSLQSYAATATLGQNTVNSWLITPPINTGNSASSVVHYSVAVESSTRSNTVALQPDDTLILYYSTDGGETWYDSDRISVLDSSSFSVQTEVDVTDTIPFSGTIMLAFYLESTVPNSDPVDISIYDMQVSSIPGCDLPNPVIELDSVSTTSLELSWSEFSSYGAEWYLEYGPAGFALGTGIQVFTDTNYRLITGLVPNTNYDFYLKGVCINGLDISSASQVYTFTTLCTSPPSASFTNQNTSGCTYEFVVQQPDANADYNWLFSDGYTDSGISVTRTFPNTGSYTVELTVNSSCGQAVHIDTLSVSCVGIEEIVQSNEIIFFPNPSDGMVYFEAKGFDQKVAKLAIYNSDGRLVYRSSDSWDLKATYIIDMILWPKGVYYVWIEIGNRSVYKKIIRI